MRSTKQGLLTTASRHLTARMHSRCESLGDGPLWMQRKKRGAAEVSSTLSLPHAPRRRWMPPIVVVLRSAQTSADRVCELLEGHATHRPAHRGRLGALGPRAYHPILIPVTGHVTRP